MDDRLLYHPPAPWYRPLSDYTKQEAEALLARYVAEYPARLEAFRAEVLRRGGPAEGLELHRDALVPLWTWFVPNHELPPEPVPEAVVRAADPPWWFEFHTTYAMELGPDLARFATLLAAHLAAVAIAERPGSRFVRIADRRRAYYNYPALAVAGAVEWPVDITCVIFIIHALGQDLPEKLRGRDPEGLRRHYTYHVPEAGFQPPPPPPRPTRPYDVDVLEPPIGPYSHELVFDDAVAHWAEARIGRFIAELEASPGITAVLHEDRELVRFAAPDLPLEAVVRLVDQAWRAAARRRKG